MAQAIDGTRVRGRWQVQVWTDGSWGIVSAHESAGMARFRMGRIAYRFNAKPLRVWDASYDRFGGAIGCAAERGGECAAAFFSGRETHCDACRSALDSLPTRPSCSTRRGCILGVGHSGLCDPGPGFAGYGPYDPRSEAR